MVGIKQLYELGRFFRKRYNNFIEEFNPANIHVVASQSDRAIVSAQAMLRGFFPAHNSQLQWLEGEQWQPLPFYIETTEKSTPLLHPTNYHCPRYNKLLDDDKGPIHNAMMDKYAEVVKMLANVTGIGDKLYFDQVASLMNIQREMYHQLPQPEWVYQKWPQYHNMRTIDIIKEFKRVSRVSEYDTPDKARLRGGLLLGDIIDRFQNVSTGNTVKARQMHLYSAHDATVAALLYALNISNGILVPYSACLIIELYQTWTNEKVVKFLFKNETDNEDAYELFVPQCAMPCTLNRLIEITSSAALHTVDELHEACIESRPLVSKFNTNSNQSNNNSGGAKTSILSMYSIPFISILSYVVLMSHL